MKIFQPLFYLIVSVAAIYAQDFSAYDTTYTWTISPTQIANLEKAEPAADNVSFDEADVPNYTLPDLFKLANGTKVTTKQVWEEQRRGEMIDSIRRILYGYAPPKPTNLSFNVVQNNANAMSGAATFKRVAISFKLGSAAAYTFYLNIFIPNQRTGKAPVFLLLNHRGASAADYTRQNKSEFWPAEYIVARGYAAAEINVSPEVEPDQENATTGVRTYYKNNYSNPGQLTWGAISAWAWAGHRAADYFATDPDIDTSRIAVIGHSRSAKASLWCGAQDSRIAITCVNCSGQGGPGIVRRLFGRTLKYSVELNPHWYSPIYITYGGRENELPYDGHFLIGLVTPRAVHVSGASTDIFNDPQGSYDALNAGDTVWSLFYGKSTSMPVKVPLVNTLLNKGPVAYHMRTGEHDLKTYDWKNYMDHADAYYSGPTGIVNKKVTQFQPAHQDANKLTVYSINGRNLGEYADVAASFQRITHYTATYASQPLVLMYQQNGRTITSRIQVLSK